MDTPAWHHDTAIIDDGAHLPSTLGGRRGLAGMAERAAIFGGTFHAGPRPGRGWEVHVTLPIRR